MSRNWWTEYDFFRPVHWFRQVIEIVSSFIFKTRIWEDLQEIAFLPNKMEFKTIQSQLMDIIDVRIVWKKLG